jgi:hypothetical protein
MKNKIPQMKRFKGLLALIIIWAGFLGRRKLPHCSSLVANRKAVEHNKKLILAGVVIKSV